MKISPLLFTLTCLLIWPTLSHADEANTARAHYCDCIAGDQKEDQEALCRTQTQTAHPEVTQTFTSADCAPKPEAKQELGSTLDGVQLQRSLGSGGSSDGFSGELRSHGLSIGSLGTGKWGKGGANGGGYGMARGGTQTRQLAPNSRIVTSGKFPTSFVRKRLNSVYRKLNACFSRSLKKFPKRKVELEVHFKVKRYGQVDDVKVVRSSYKNSRLNKCLSRILRNIRFPQSKDKGSALIKYTMIYT